MGLFKKNLRLRESSGTRKTTKKLGTPQVVAQHLGAALRRSEKQPRGSLTRKILAKHLTNLKSVDRKGVSTARYFKKGIQ